MHEQKLGVRVLMAAAVTFRFLEKFHIWRSVFNSITVRLAGHELTSDAYLVYEKHFCAREAAQIVGGRVAPAHIGP